MHLVRDILDSQLVDSEGRRIGKADGIVLRLRDGKAPLLVAIEVGGITPARRLPRPFRGMLEALARRFGARKGEPYRIPWSKVHREKINVRVDLDASRTPLLEWERRIRDHIIGRLPGAGTP